MSSAGSHGSGRRQGSRSTSAHYAQDTPSSHLASQYGPTESSNRLPHVQRQEPLLKTGSVTTEKPLPNTPSSPSFPRKAKMILSRWGWELSSCLGAVIGIIAIYGLLMRYNDKTVPDWPNIITINSLVSIFSTLLKALMLVSIAECLGQLKWLWFEHPRSLKDIDTYDEASRGPSGSSKLLWKLRAHHLAALGAYITILAIGVDPFAQQAIQYYNCFKIDNKRTASIPVSRYRDSGSSQFDGKIIGALWDGLLNPSGNNTAIQPHCPTGTCDFEAKYSSLGFCSGCMNSIYQVWTNGGTQEGDRLFPKDVYQQNWMTHHLPSSLYLNQPNLPGRYNTALKISSFADASYRQPLEKGPFRPKSGPYATANWTIDGVGAPLLFISTLAPTSDKKCTSGWIKDGPKKSTDCIVPRMVSPEMERHAREPTGIYIDNYGKPGGREWKHIGNGSYGFPPLIDWPNVTSSICYLSYCAKSYSATMRNGTFQESLIGEHDVLNLDANDSTRNSFVSNPCVTNNETYQLSDFLDVEAAKKSGAIINRDPNIDGEQYTGVAGNYTKLRDALPPGSRNRTILDACTFSMSRTEYMALRTALPTYLDGQGKFSDEAHQPKPYLDPWMNATWVNWDTNLQLSAFFNGGSPSVRHSEKTMKNLADAMTNHLRKNDARGSVVNGEMYRSETCVRAAWPWLTLPLVLVLGTCVFQIATMFKATRHSQMVGNKDNVWKSSQLALLFHGLDEEPTGPVFSLNDMDSKAEKMKVKLSAEDQGWKLVSPGPLAGSP